MNILNASEVNITITLPTVAQAGRVVSVNINQQSIFLGGMWYTNTDPNVDLYQPSVGQLLTEEGKPTWLFNGTTWRQVEEKRTIDAKTLLRLQQESMAAVNSMEEFARLINRYFHQE